MAIEQVIVYSCPYCSTLIFFEKKEDLALHIYISHIKQAIELISKDCKEVAKKKDMKWCLT